MARALLLGLFLVASAARAEVADGASAPIPEELTVAARLERARAAMADLEYVVAREELLEAIDDPRATDAELADAHLLAGIVNRILENDVEARMHFAFVLDRDVHAALPDDQPPKVKTFFELVRTEVERTNRVAAPVPAPPPSTEPAATPAPLPVADPAPRSSWLPMSLKVGGGACFAVGTVCALPTVTLATISEISFLDVTNDTETRQNSQDLGCLMWGCASCGGLFMLVGALVASSGFVAEASE